jgi:F-type H+-transporting ATPase subunit a
MSPTSKLQVLIEWTYETFAGFCRNVIGPESDRFVPFLATQFMFILLLNYCGLLPGFISPTTSLNITLALALSTFGMVQMAGFRAHGLRYLMHFVGEPIWLAPLNIPIHIIGELARPLSLSIRLFGNIFGEDMVIAKLIGMAAVALPWWLPIPFQFPMLLFGLFTGFVQALVFLILSAAYVGGAVDKHEAHEGQVPGDGFQVSGTAHVS